MNFTLLSLAFGVVVARTANIVIETDVGPKGPETKSYTADLSKNNGNAIVEAEDKAPDYILTTTDKSSNVVENQALLI
jgi:hypothetical protein